MGAGGHKGRDTGSRWPGGNRAMIYRGRKSGALRSAQGGVGDKGAVQGVSWGTELVKGLI